MRHILARLHRPLLEQFAWSQVLIAFDFDGTLAPIVDDPTAAVMPASTRRLFREVATLYPCVVISGRSRADLATRLRGVALREIVGNHGLEPARGGRQRATFAAHVARWVPRLERALRDFPGVVVEDKRLSVAVHYRASRKKKQALAAIDAVVAQLGPLRAFGGKQVVNLVPPQAPHKGLALEAARRRAHCDTALYVGDDDTDEDVFALQAPGRLLSIRVGRRAGSQAGYYLRDRAEVDRLLGFLRDLRGSARKRAVVGASVGAGLG
jgi:trehalose 6-phosphate phosphatase